MHTSDLLAIWDRGHVERRERWALTLLAAAEPALDAAALAGLSVGERDARLLALRNRLFGRRLELADDCPACDTPLDLDIDGAALLADPPASTPDDFRLRCDDVDLQLRLPDSIDLAAAADCVDADAAAAVLLARCVAQARRGEHVVDPAQLSPTAVEAVSARLAALDPQADVTLRLRCEACGHEWPRAFDVLPVVWRELDGWATTMLRDVHALASSYGWAEETILAMGTTRRRRYLDLLRG